MNDEIKHLNSESILFIPEKDYSEDEAFAFAESVRWLEVKYAMEQTEQSIPLFDYYSLLADKVQDQIPAD
jgi:hypothetical protein